MHDYILCGWHLRADRALPVLTPCHDHDATPDIVLQHAAICRPAHDIVFSSPFITVYASGEAMVHINNAVTILVSDGRQITVDTANSGNDWEVLTFLLGPALGMLCHQRRVLPLHAAAIRIGDVAVALVGHSGAGKSTTAAAMVARGHQLLCDDIMVLDDTQRAAVPSYGGIKLWQDAASALAIDTAALNPTRPGLQKFHYPAVDGISQTPVPLAAVMILSPRTSDAHCRQSTHNKLAAVAMLSQLIYRRPLCRALGAEPSCMMQLGQLISAVPVLGLSRPDNLATLPQVLDMIESVATA